MNLTDECKDSNGDIMMNDSKSRNLFYNFVPNLRISNTFWSSQISFGSIHVLSIAQRYLVRQTEQAFRLESR